MNNEMILLGHFPGKAWKQARSVLSGGGLSKTLTAEMGGHGNDYLFVNVEREVLGDEEPEDPVP